MPNMMCAVQIRYGAFTDYFLPANMVIRMLEDIAGDSVNPGNDQLTIPWSRLELFLQQSDDAAIARAGAAVELRRTTGRPDPEIGDDEWGRAVDFLDWFHNMQSMLQNGEFEPFVDPHAKTITFNFS